MNKCKNIYVILVQLINIALASGADPGILERVARTERRRGPPQKIVKNYMWFPAIWHIFLGSEWPRISYKWHLCRTKNSSGHNFDSHTHAYIPTLPKTPRISATIKSKFNFKHIFSDIVYYVENKIDFAKNRGAQAPTPLDPPLSIDSLLLSFIYALFSSLLVNCNMHYLIFFMDTIKLIDWFMPLLQYL